MSLYNNHLDSQATLIGTNAHDRTHSIISFTRDDMKNTRILSADERILFDVTTDKLTNTHTIIRRRDTDEVVAEVKRKELLPDTIQFGVKEKTKLSKWLHGENGKKWSDYPVSFEWQGSTYTWKTDEKQQIALYEGTDPYNSIAWFQPSKKETTNGIPTIYRALLVLQPKALEIIDSLVVSFLIIKANLRILESKYHNGDGRIDRINI